MPYVIARLAAFFRGAIVFGDPAGDGLLFSTGKSPIQALAFSLTALSDNL
jgi:hypothetical protein